MAPSFDHASSLSRELRDERRIELLSTGRVDWYVNKGRGGIFGSSEERHGENPLRLVQLAARAHPSFFKPSLEKAAALSHESIQHVIESIPDGRATRPAKQFAQAMILSSQASLIEILK